MKPHLPPVLNIIALATFAASLSARALDPVLPHVAEDFGVSIATAASFAAVFAFTFAIVQPVLGAAADLFGKARLMIVCLVLLGLASILGALSTSFPMLFARASWRALALAACFRLRSASPATWSVPTSARSQSGARLPAR
jgi:predicted MFS family arabinose efflux permease